MKILINFSRLLALWGLIFMFACSDINRTEVDFQIDNPTEKVMSVRIDDQEYKIDPMTSKTVTLSMGIHKLDSERTGQIEFMVYGDSSGKGVLLNPSFSTYYLMSEVYAESDKARKGFQPGVRKVMIDGVEYQGAIQALNGLFITRQWSYSLDEDFPESVGVYDNQRGAIKDKIFRKMALVAYMEDQYGEIGKYASTHQPPAATQVSYPDFEKSLHVFQYAPVETAAKPLKALYTSYLQNRNPEQIQAMQKAYFDAQMAFTGETATLIVKMDTADREAYNHFVSSVSSLFGQSARVLHPPQ